MEISILSSFAVSSIAAAVTCQPSFVASGQTKPTLNAFCSSFTVLLASSVLPTSLSALGLSVMLLFDFSLQAVRLIRAAMTISSARIFVFIKISPLIFNRLRNRLNLFCILIDIFLIVNWQIKKRFIDFLVQSAKIFALYKIDYFSRDIFFIVWYIVFLDF